MKASKKETGQANLSTVGDLKFLTKLSVLKQTPRKGWLAKAGIERPESVADHLYRTAMMALVFSYGRPDLDKRRLLEMALIHDLAEITIGDLMPEEKIGSKAELRAELKIISSLESRVRKRLALLLTEYHDGRSPEAIMLKQIDKLEMALQAREYEREGNDKKKFEDFWSTAKRSIYDPHLTALLEGIESLE